MHSLIVVTAGYHMPRALAELRRALPDVTLYPVPVQPPAMRARRRHRPARVCWRRNTPSGCAPASGPVPAWARVRRSAG